MKTLSKEQLNEFMAQELLTEPDFPFNKDFESAVYRHKHNRKWFALLMEVDKNKFDLSKEEQKALEKFSNVWVLNVKVDPMFRFSAISQMGVKPSYHMNKTHWVSAILPLADEEVVKSLIETSFDLTK